MCKHEHQNCWQRNFFSSSSPLARCLSFSFINVAVIINKIFTKVIWITCSTKTFKTQLYNTFWKDLRWSGKVSIVIPFEKIDSGKEIYKCENKVSGWNSKSFLFMLFEKKLWIFWEWKGFFSVFVFVSGLYCSVSATVYNSRMFKSFLGDKSGWYFMVAQRFGTEI